MHSLSSLVGLPYEQYNCWDLIAKYHKLDIRFRGDIKSDFGKYKFATLAKKLFIQIEKPEFTGDVCLQGNHVMLYVKEPVEGYIQAVIPYSEFVVTDHLDMPKDTTYWRLNEDNN